MPNNKISRKDLPLRDDPWPDKWTFMPTPDGLHHQRKAPPNADSSKCGKYAEGFGNRMTTPYKPPSNFLCEECEKIANTI